MTDPLAEAEVQIERIAAGGDGVGRWPDGRVVFVPRTAPGERAVVSAVLDRPRYLKGELRRIVDPGPHRVVPSCSHYDDDMCGGCQLQHLDESTQQAVKRSIVGDALRRLAGLDVEDPPIVPAYASWEYRSKISLSRAGMESFGFHRLQPAGSVFALDHCRVAAPSLMAMWQVLGHHPEVIPHKADRIVLREDGTGRRHVVAYGNALQDWPEAEACAALLSASGTEASLSVAGAGAGARHVAGPTALVAGLAFEQVNPVMGARVRQDAVAELGSVAGSHVWDLYAGLGQTAALLATSGATVSCVEHDGAAVRSAPVLTGVRWFEGPAEAVTRRLDPPDMVITNPPRTGMAKAVLESLLASGPEKIVYVSCDPATMARDVQRLSGGFRLTRVTAYDLFPQTAHIESVVLMERQ